MPRPNREKNKGTKPTANLPPRPAPGPQGQPARPTGQPAAPANGAGQPEPGSGYVAISAPIANGVGVVKIVTTLEGGKRLAKHYLLRCLGALKFSLSEVHTVDTAYPRDGYGTYAVSIKSGVVFCGCQHWQKTRAECKHIKAIRTLMAQDKL
jgi:hypothetical protein